MENKKKKNASITEKRKQTRRLLNNTNCNYHQFLENPNCIVLRLDDKGKILHFNDFAQKLLGYTEKQIVGKNILETIITKILSPELNPKQFIKDIKKKPEKYANYEIEVTTKDGRQIWIVWDNKVINNGQEDTTEILCLGHEITERKRMENEFQLFATAVKNSNDAITVQDLDGNIIFWNPGAERIYGYTKEEALKMNTSRIIPAHKQAEMKMLIRRIIADETVDFFETQRYDKNNRVLNISLTVTLLKDKDGNPFIISTNERDITERRRLEKEILDTSEREREIISQEMHDGMGQILAGIAINSKGLALKLKKKHQEEISDAIMISNLANKAISQMRDIAKLLYPSELETGGLISALKLLAVSAGKTLGVKCRFQCSKYASVKDMLEAKQIYRIAQEAITNAVKHGKAKNINIKLRFVETGNILTIENDGIDFVKPSSKRKGLGLKIMKYRSDLIGGSLDIRKRSKGGTIVECFFPLAENSIIKKVQK